MIRVVKDGRYKITETWGETRIISLDEREHYAWVYAGKEIGEILVVTKKKFSSHYTLARSRYRLYQVREEKDLSDGFHLELCVGEGFWQAYLLPNGLPSGVDRRNKLIPTAQIITQPSLLRLV